MSYREEVKRITSTAETPGEAKERLLAIDGRYPEKPLAKIHLGVLYLMEGRLEEAGAYLERALALEKREKLTEEEYYLLYGALSDYYTRKKDYASARSYAERALARSAEDVLGIGVLLARSMMHLDDTEGAGGQYRAQWETKRDFFTQEDLTYFMRYLQEKGEWKPLREVALYSVERYGYRRGDGLILSSIAEKEGDWEESILWAFLDLWFLYKEGVYERSAVLSRLNSVRETLLENRVNETEFSSALLLCHRIVEEEWDDASSLLEQLRDDNRSLPVSEFFRYIVSFHRERPVHISTLQEYVDLEPFFKTQGIFYYYLWWAMSKGEGNYTFSTVHKVLEKAIYLLPADSKYQNESRNEIVRLLGLSPEAARNLLVTPEIDRTIEAFRQSGEKSLLRPLAYLLTLENNPYVDYAIQQLKQFSAFYDVKAYFENIIPDPPARYRIRLQEIFGS